MEELFKERKQKIISFRKLLHREKKVTRKDVPENIFVQCPKCKETILSQELEASYYVCPHCHQPLKIDAYTRLKYVLDEGSFHELYARMVTDPKIDFPGYQEKLARERKKSGLRDAFVCGVGRIEGMKVAIGVLDSRFFMGSMGSVVGEKVTLLIEYATKKKLPLIIFTASGGARMQEGIVSLMQMAKTSAALSRFQSHGGLYISYLTDPTTGGVTASFGMLGDLILAEPRALIGFAGPRVVEQTIKRKLPEGFQTSEFLLEHGFVDMIVERADMQKTLALLLRLHGGEKR